MHLYMAHCVMNHTCFKKTESSFVLNVFQAQIRRRAPAVSKLIQK